MASRKLSSQICSGRNHSPNVLSPPLHPSPSAPPSWLPPSPLLVPPGALLVVPCAPPNTGAFNLHMLVENPYPSLQTRRQALRFEHLQARSAPGYLFQQCSPGRKHEQRANGSVHWPSPLATRILPALSPRTRPPPCPATTLHKGPQLLESKKRT